MSQPNKRRPDGYSAYRSPGATNRDVAFSRLPDYPLTLLNEEIYPDVAYSGTTYWADLPARERNMFKEDPLAPFNAYHSNFVITGVGFSTEGYVLFNVGNILPLFESVYPVCFKQYQVCNEVWVQMANYLEVVGIIFGQCVVGVIGDWIGRRWGLIQDAAVMFLGSLMLTSMWGTSLYGWTVMYAISLLALESVNLKYSEDHCQGVVADQR